MIKWLLIAFFASLLLQFTSCAVDTTSAEEQEFILRGENPKGISVNKIVVTTTIDETDKTHSFDSTAITQIITDKGIAGFQVSIGIVLEEHSTFDITYVCYAYGLPVLTVNKSYDSEGTGLPGDVVNDSNLVNILYLFNDQSVARSLLPPDHFDSTFSYYILHENNENPDALFQLYQTKSESSLSLIEVMIAQLEEGGDESATETISEMLNTLEASDIVAIVTDVSSSSLKEAVEQESSSGMENEVSSSDGSSNVGSSEPVPSSSSISIEDSSGQQNLTIAFNSFGNGTLSTSSLEVVAGVSTEVAGISSIPSDGYAFSEWVAATGECTIDNVDPLFITCSQSSTVKARFAKKEYTISLEKTGSCGLIGTSSYSFLAGAEAVSLDISRGDYCSVVGVTSPDLEITQSGNSYFVSGINDGSYDPIGNEYTVTAEFETVAVPQVEISFACFLGGTSVSCGDVHSATLNTVTIKETDGAYTFVPAAQQGYSYNNLTVGTNVGISGEEVSYSTSGAGVVNVNYTRVAYMISVKTAGNGTVNPTSASIAHGASTELSITPTPQSGYIFKQWVGYDGCTINDQVSPTVTCNLQGYIEAEFEAIYVKQVSAGKEHTMFLKSDGSLWGTGYNMSGQIGDMSNENKSSPVKVMDNVSFVAAGDYHTMIVKTDGTLWATGGNTGGQFGVAIPASTNDPIQIMSEVKSVAVGNTHTMILKTDGSLYATGGNHFGQLGTGSNDNVSIPTFVMSSVKQVSARSNHTVILTTNGTVYTTGDNNYGQLGTGDNDNVNDPVQIMTAVDYVYTSVNHTMMVKANGTLWGMGFNYFYQLGIGNDDNQSSPVQLQSGPQGMTGVKSVAAGRGYTLIIKTDNSLWGIGDNGSGEFGNGSKMSQNSAIFIESGISSVSVGESHSLVIKSNGTAWATGENYYGFLGDGSTVSKSTFTQINF
ncbi:MAG: hypothetical protein OCD76_24660 [Reichenbachiella sp.]